MASAAVPVNVVTVVALIDPEVLPSSVFNTDAAKVVSSRVTASFPNPVIVPAVFAEYAVFAAAAVPVRIVTAEAFTATVVLALRSFKAVLSTVLSVIVMV